MIIFNNIISYFTDEYTIETENLHFFFKAQESNLTIYTYKL